MIYMPTCQQVAREIASDELATASWRRRSAVRIHLLLCRHCRRYARQMRAIGSAVQSLFEIQGALSGAVAGGGVAAATRKDDVVVDAGTPVQLQLTAPFSL